MPYTTFESQLVVRPDDIDMNNHVHFSRYLDYVLAARYDQMERCYGMSMEKFVARGFGWVVKSCNVEYKRPLFLGEQIVVRTAIADLTKTDAKVRFEIIKQQTGKISAEGHFWYSLVNVTTGRAEQIPEDVIRLYSI